MTLSTVCPNCGKRSAIEKTQAGKVIQCPGCRLPFLAPNSEEESLDLVPLHDPRKIPPPKPVSQSATNAAPNTGSPGAAKVVPAVKVASAGPHDLSELLNDKILKEFQKDADSESQDAKKKRKRTPWMTPEAAGYLKLGGMAMLMILLLAGGVAVYTSGVIQIPVIPGQGPSFTLANPRSTRQGKKITIAIDYVNRGKGPQGQEKLMWVLQGPSSLIELDVTARIQSAGSLSGDFVASNNASIAGFESRFELHQGGQTRVVSNVVKLP